MDSALIGFIHNIPQGYTLGEYQGKTYGIQCHRFNDGRSYKVYAEELGGKDFISCNYYALNTKGLLKPCEMPKQKVIDFLTGVKLL